MRLRVYLQVDISPPSNELRVLVEVLILLQGIACSHQEPTKIKSLFLCKNFFEGLKATVEASGMPGSFSGPF